MKKHCEDADKRMKLIMKASGDAKKEVVIDNSDSAMLSVVAQRVLRNLHVVIAVTPSSAALDRIVTSFPSLLGSLTIDWYTPWDIETLKSIAQNKLKQNREE